MCCTRLASRPALLVSQPQDALMPDAVESSCPAMYLRTNYQQTGPYMTRYLLAHAPLSDVCELNAATSACDTVHQFLQGKVKSRQMTHVAKMTMSTGMPVQVAKDSNGNAKITNMHLLRCESHKPSLRLLVTITDSRGPGRIESREVEPRRNVEDVVTLEATEVDSGRSSEYGSSEVIVFTSAEQGTGLKGAILVTCLLQIPAPVKALARRWCCGWGCLGRWICLPPLLGHVTPVSEVRRNFGLPLGSKTATKGLGNGYGVKTFWCIIKIDR